MNQPDLGLKVSELRQQKALTQEQLAELCEVSARTIQRIESGEVDPRAYTLQCLSKALEFDFGAEGSPNENLWLTILHLSTIFCIVLTIRVTSSSEISLARLLGSIFASARIFPLNARPTP